MPKLTLRRCVWTAVGLLTVVVLSTGVAYTLVRDWREAQQTAKRPLSYDENAWAEEQRAKALPEYAELRKLNAKENRPFTPATVARLGEITRHPNFFLRDNAVGFLGNTTGPARADAVKWVVPRLNDTNQFVRLAAIDVLARLDAKEHIPELLTIRDKGDEDERQLAQIALRKLGHSHQ
jgi:HEAT repeat protein